MNITPISKDIENYYYNCLNKLKVRSKNVKTIEIIERDWEKEQRNSGQAEMGNRVFLRWRRRDSIKSAWCGFRGANKKLAFVLRPIKVGPEASYL